MGFGSLYLAWQSREFRKFLAGAFFVSCGSLFYLYLADVSVPLLGTSFVETPQISGGRSIVHFVLFLLVSNCGAESGALVTSSKNGVGLPSPRNHHPRSLDPRRAKTESDGDGAAFGGSRPTAERSKMRQRGRPSTPSREGRSAS